MQEDWDLLLTFFPSDWERLAAESGALKGLRKDKSPENLLRVLLMHLGCGHSLRETVVRARQAGLADLSDVALMKRLKKSEAWLQALCRALFEERGVATTCGGVGFEVRAVDATTVKEPGKTGSLWRLHYSVRLPSLVCDHFRVTSVKGPGSGESLTGFPIARGDHVMGDRGYSTARGIAHVFASGGYVTVRVNTGIMCFEDATGRRIDLLDAVKSLEFAGCVGSWPVTVVGEGSSVPGRVCALRKSETAIRIAQRKLDKDARRKGRTTRPETLEFAKYVILFTTFPESEFTAEAVLDWYRLRWQVELVFKRFKSVAKLGHLPKHHDESSRAWLYGKLFTALLVEKLIESANTLSPWGYNSPATPNP